MSTAIYHVLLQREEERYGGTLTNTKINDYSEKKRIEFPLQIHDDFHKEIPIQCSYEDYLLQCVKFEFCGKKNCSNMLHHVCQNNFDSTTHRSQFEKMYGLMEGDLNV